MVAAAAKFEWMTRADIEKKFREELGRELTSEEKQILGLADKALAESTEPAPEKTKKPA